MVAELRSDRLRYPTEGTNEIWYRRVWWIKERKEQGLEM